jgi:hypothetical protein
MKKTNIALTSGFIATISGISFAQERGVLNSEANASGFETESAFHQDSQVKKVLTLNLTQEQRSYLKALTGKETTDLKIRIKKVDGLYGWAIN